MKNGNSWYRRIADTITELVSIDLIEDNPGGYPTIHWLIANHMLRELAEFDRLQNLPSFVSKIKGGLYPAIDYLRRHGTPVYWVIPEDHKMIEFMTIDARRSKARRHNTDRIKRNMFAQIEKGINQLQFTDPNSLKHLPHVKKALPELIG